MNVVNVKGQKREKLGTKYARAARKEGMVPCVVYGPDTLFHFVVPSLDLRDVIYTPEFSYVDIEVDGQTHRCILKEFVLHPVTDAILHVDFLVLKEGVPVKVEIPVSFNGPSKGEKLGGKLIQSVRKVKVKTTPDKLVNTLVVDIHNIGLGESARVKDIPAVEGMEIMMHPNIPLATIEIPRALKSAAAAEEAKAE